MTLFQFRWLRRFIRKNTNPIPKDRAATMKTRLSFLYMLLGWNAFGFVCYMVFTGRGDWAKYHGLKSEAELAMTPAQQWCETLGIEKAKVYRISGLKKTQEYMIEKGKIVKEINDQDMNAVKEEESE